ncbi:Uma2 family endonuclease [Streptomyces sp. 891-h]|uniref:Uma2 family endonuclease n=2 Tax=unclassified Streptomyces TaxID=2593676 RepID=UPI001FA9EE67|nr:Uma2 family endonuclease [Streptomyces sp. 891-h]UNZ17579.1 Uma2 family endonuclease [Streptomyces sp. 891-h]
MGGTMTAEPAPQMNEINWPVPPPDGYTVDDLLTLPDLPPHTELIDGSLVFVSPQRNFHADVIDLLVSGLRATAPWDRLRVKREMTVVLNRRNGPEPDISVVKADAVVGPDQSRYQAADVVLAVEVVSPDSEARDRDTKPRKYAAAGIPHFWLVERAGEGMHPVVRVYELDPVAKGYTLRGNFHGRLTLDEPFGIDIDLTAVDDL